MFGYYAFACFAGLSGGVGIPVRSHCHCPHHSWMCHSKKGEPQKDQVSTLDNHCTAARWVQCYHDHGVVMGEVEYLTIVVIYQFTSHT